MAYTEFLQTGIGGMGGKIAMPRKQTLRERIEEQKKVLETQLANLNEALDFMDKNPGFENFHNIVGKAGF